MKFFEFKWHPKYWQIKLIQFPESKFDCLEKFCPELTFIPVIIFVLDMNHKFRESCLSAFSYGFDVIQANFALDLVPLNIIQSKICKE